MDLDESLCIWYFMGVFLHIRISNSTFSNSVFMSKCSWTKGHKGNLILRNVYGSKFERVMNYKNAIEYFFFKYILRDFFSNRFDRHSHLGKHWARGGNVATPGEQWFCYFTNLDLISPFKRFTADSSNTSHHVWLVSAGTIDNGMKTTSPSWWLICRNAFMFCETPCCSKTPKLVCDRLWSSQINVEILDNDSWVLWRSNVAFPLH